jgi:hypothetical protein
VNRLEALIAAYGIELVHFAALTGGHATREVANVAGLRIVGCIVGHMNTAVVVHDHQASEQVVRFGALGSAEPIDILAARHARHLPRRDALVHPLHRDACRVRCRVVPPARELGAHLTYLHSLEADDLTSDVTQGWVRAVLQVRVPELDRLEMMRLHVLEEADVDAVASGVVILGDAPADHSRHQAQRQNEDQRLGQRWRPRRQPAPGTRSLARATRRSSRRPRVNLGTRRHALF